MDTLKLSRYNRLNKGCVDMKKYNSEFKSMIVELYKTGRAVKELSREYDVSEEWGPQFFCFSTTGE